MIYKITPEMCRERVVDDLGLVMFQDAPYSILGGSDHNKGIRVFKDLIDRTLVIYNRYYAAWLAVEFNNSNANSKEYTFVDNFDAYLDGTVPERSIELVPISIAKVGNIFVSSYYFIYKNPTLYARFSQLSGQCYYFANHPNRVEIGPDGNFTENSAIYFLEEKFNERFFTFLSLEVGRRIKRIVRSIDYGGNIQILQDMEQTLSELEQRVDEYIETASTIYRMWRK